jgi:hypothetical protein
MTARNLQRRSCSDLVQTGSRWLRIQREPLFAFALAAGLFYCPGGLPGAPRRLGIGMVGSGWSLLTIFA